MRIRGYPRPLYGGYMGPTYEWYFGFDPEYPSSLVGKHVTHWLDHGH